MQPEIREMNTKAGSDFSGIVKEQLHAKLVGMRLAAFVAT